MVDATLPDERLTEDDLAVTIFDEPRDPNVVLGDDDGFVAAVVRTAGDRRIGYVKILGVTPVARRGGHGRALVLAAEEWARANGAQVMQAGGSAPYYLWPGVDVRFTGAMALFEAAGYRPTGAAVDLSFPASFTAKVPEGFVVRRALEDIEADAVVDFCRRHWPHWVPEVERGVEHGACHVVCDASTESVVGFGCHSVNWLGVLGPIGTDPDRRDAGVGTALLGAIARDVRAMGLSSVRVSWIGPFRFYAKAAGAAVSRTYLQLVKTL